MKGAAKTLGIAGLGYVLADPAKLDLITKALATAGKGAQVAKPAVANWVRVQIGDDHYQVHPDDLNELQRREPSLYLASRCHTSRHLRS